MKDPSLASAAESYDDKPIVTLQQHILQQQRANYPSATGEFSWLLSGITLATKMIQDKVRHAGLNDILGTFGDVNVQGEVQQKLDVYANRVLLHCLGVRETVAVLASEENEKPVTLRGTPSAKYVVVFDPLDGSSNIDVNVGVGTIFSILLRRSEVVDEDPALSVLQAGHQQLAAGYVFYGASTVLVYTTGHGVHAFTLDPAIGAYVLVRENVRMPEQGPYYSVNEAYADRFPPGYAVYLERLKSGALGRRYTSRYVGSLVADFHRTLFKGGVFLYPQTLDHQSGKLRLLYEANPMAFITEQAGGQATTGSERLLDIVPTSIHQRTPMAVGSHVEMNELHRCLLEAGST